MNPRGVDLTLMIGPTLAVPAPAFLLEALESVEVRHDTAKDSGFQLVFRVGRSGPFDLRDFKLLALPILKTDFRVVITVAFGGRPRVLMDGVITRQQLSPGAAAGASTLTVDGVDLSALMNREARQEQHLGLNEMGVVLKIIARYATFGLTPMVVPPLFASAQSAVDRVPVQDCTDLEYLQHLAELQGYVFHVRPGPRPMMNVAYWGPPIESTLPQKALSVRLGGETNVESLDFRHDGEAPSLVAGWVRDPGSGTNLPVQTFASTRVPPLASYPALQLGLSKARRALLGHSSGIGYAQALARAQAETNRSCDSVLTASGRLDAVRYGGLLEARRLVGVRGAGFLYDGLYRVQSVTHQIRRGEYKQSFTLGREGLGSTTQVVPV